MIQLPANVSHSNIRMVCDCDDESIIHSNEYSNISPTVMSVFNIGCLSRISRKKSVTSSPFNTQSAVNQCFHFHFSAYIIVVGQSSFDHNGVFQLSFRTWRSQWANRTSLYVEHACAFHVQCRFNFQFTQCVLYCHNFTLHINLTNSFKLQTSPPNASICIQCSVVRIIKILNQTKCHVLPAACYCNRTA